MVQIILHTQKGNHFKSPLCANRSQLKPLSNDIWPLNTALAVALELRKPLLKPWLAGRCCCPLCTSVTRWVQALFEALHLPCAAFQTAPTKKDLSFQPALFWLNLIPAKPNGSFPTIFNGSRGMQTSVFWKAAVPCRNLQSRQHYTP